MCPFDVLPGLPPYGPEALAFDPSGMQAHREGYVLRFAPPGAVPWVGNFQPGMTDVYEILQVPGSDDVIVVSGGMGYRLNPASPEHWSHFGGQIDYVREVSELNAVLLGNGLWFELMAAESLIWRTRRISWDGMRDIEIRDLKLSGKSWHYTDTWSDFYVDLVEGTVTGGSYDWPGT